MLLQVPHVVVNIQKLNPLVDVGFYFFCELLEDNHELDKRLRVICRSYAIG